MENTKHYAWWQSDKRHPENFYCSECDSYPYEDEEGNPAAYKEDENGNKITVPNGLRPHICPNCQAKMLNKEDMDNLVIVFKDKNGSIVNYIYSNPDIYCGEPLDTVIMANQFNEEKPEPIEEASVIREEELLKLLLSKYKINSSQDITDALPVKPGTNVYQRYHKFPSEIESFHIAEDGTCYYEWVEYDRSGDETEVWDSGTFAVEEIGKTVFLTPDELV